MHNVPSTCLLAYTIVGTKTSGKLLTSQLFKSLNFSVPQPVLTNPFLQLQTTPFVEASWEHVAFESHPPLFT
ncbi:unnamed protein product [Rotaria magnacalcarata]|uniref:Uncharacterized protein n=1 Tax=Rotaria magnacalcarata TaxID=392030 RepID=A0A8S2YRS1_9BILA|nr:unnamed protein product [Rotaria magnacalcarata]